MKLSQKLSTQQFIISHILILVSGLFFIFGLYYILNIQYQPSKKPFVYGPVTTLPKTLTLDLDHPEDNSLIFQDSIIVSGQTSPSKEVLIFTESQDLILISKKDGSFSTVLNLDEGVNNIVVAVFDAKGETKSAERTVYYSEEKI